VVLKEEEAHDRGLAPGAPHQRRGEMGELVGQRFRRSVRFAHPLGGPCRGVAIHLAQERLLPGEVPVQGALGDAGMASDVAGGRGAVTLCGEQLESCTQQPFPREIGLLHRRANLISFRALRPGQ